MRDYNFFSAYDKKKELKISPSSPYFIAGIILLVAVLATGGLVVRNMMLENEIRALQDETAALQATAEYQEANAAQSALRELDLYEKSADMVLADFEKHNVLGTTILDQVTASLPVTAVATSLTINHASMSGSFSVPDKRTASELILRLEESGLFHTVHAPNVFQSEGQAGYTVLVECEVKAGGLE